MILIIILLIFSDEIVGIIDRILEWTDNRKEIRELESRNYALEKEIAELELLLSKERNKNEAYNGWAEK